MLTDTHIHLDDEKFEGRLDEVMKRACDRGMRFILNPGCEERTSARAIEIAHTYPEVFAAVGYHPLDADRYQGEVSLDQMRSWLEDPKVLAVGEIGLDYHYDDSPSKMVQKKAFEDQMILAAEQSVPVIIHDREAHQDCFDIVQSLLNREASGVFHAYSGSVEMAKRILDLGMYISIGGPITFKNARKTPDVIAYMPLDRILLETDGPYMAPEPIRGSVNEPANTYYIAKKMAEIKKMDLERFLEITEENARRLFKPAV